jgi:hypothetical protein
MGYPSIGAPAEVHQIIDVAHVERSFVDVIRVRTPGTPPTVIVSGEVPSKPGHAAMT